MGLEQRWRFSFLLGCTLLMLNPFMVSSDDATNKQVLSNINSYRKKAGYPVLTENAGAACLAGKILDKLKDSPCDNSTEKFTLGFDPQYPDYPDMVKSCKLKIVNTTGGQVLTDCNPSSKSSTSKIVTQNFTMSLEYQKYINSTDYTSAGVVSENVWVVLILATNASDGNYLQTSRAETSALTNFGFASIFSGLITIFLFFLSLY